MTSFVDLRSNIETVYHQAGTNACTAHAAVNMLDAMYDSVGENKRFSRAWIWWWSRVNSGRAGQDVGAVYNDLKFALETKGAILESQQPWTGHAANFPPKDAESVVGKITTVRVAPSVDAVKERLVFGFPVSIGIDIVSDFNSLYGQKDWRKTKYNTKSSFTGVRHAMCIVGFDDSCERLLIENSYGPGFADGGFFGLPYSDLPTVGTELWTISRIYGFHPKKAEDHVAIPYLLAAQDYTEYLIRNKPRLRNAIAQAFETQGLQAAIDVCKAEGVTDKLLENLFLWDRFTVQKFQEDPQNANINWDGFVFSTT